MAQTLGSVAVESIVKIDENGSPVNYIVLHIGNPDVRLYGSTCDGAWLLRQDFVENVQWNSTNANTLAGSTVMSTMAGYLGRYESHIQSAIKTVKIPYHPGNGEPSWGIKSGENGLECKLFPLCGYEVGLSDPSGIMPADGAKLDYFKSGLDTEANSKRIAKLNGAAAAWWLRSPVSTSTDGKFYILPDGSLGSTSVNPSYGALPAMIMDPTILVSDDGTVGVPASPTALNVPIQVMQGRQITASWSAVDGVSSYILERKADTDADWVQVYSGANTSFEETVGTWTSVQYRVKSLANGKYGDYTTSTSVSVVPLSALVISGSDGSLGTLTNDVQYSVSSSGTSTLTVTETINGVNTRTYTATNGADNKISVVDLPTGTGTIKITASTNPGSGVVTVTREWTYTKAAITFPDAGSVADLLQNGKTIWAKTIAEAVRTPGIWGGNLGLALSKLAQAMLYDPSDSTFTDISGGAIPMVSIETGSYKGTGTSGSSNPNTLTFEFEPKALFIQEENDNYQALMLPGKTISYPFYNNGKDIMFPSRSYNRVAFSGSSVSWYCDGADSLATVQLNQSNVNYYYLVLG
ncbi:MAG: DUF6273 domain-containing protein [Dysosmobacter welbionis]|uniref:DUF6273 domain-containing protein n=1 Tax=Dysosmobacter welbionis TaxID=2093857 RepID=UPI003996BDC0